LKIFEYFKARTKKKSDDDCLIKFKDSISKEGKITEDDWSKAFKEYVKCKYEMFDRLKERERQIDERLQFGIIFCGALIPIINVIIPIGEMEYIRIISNVILGFFVTVLAGINQIKKYHERWVTFKAVARALEFEYLKLTKPGNIFSNADQKSAYDNIISILQQEVKEIVSLFKKEIPAKDDNEESSGIHRQ
jgi:hypothetical protein